MKSGLNLGLMKKEKESPYQVYFQGGCDNLLEIASFFKKKHKTLLYLKYYQAWPVCIIACKSVIEASDFSSELQFLTDLMMVCTHLQFSFTACIIPKSTYFFINYLLIFHIPSKFMINKEKSISKRWCVCVV